ncbi:MAG: flavin reductase family protein [Flavobacteriia bacterium]|nr:flavin reductase family protein [Flavobacteriia bacterium]
MISYNLKDLEVPKIHQLLLGAIGPRPIALASTIDENGVSNVSPFSFFNVFSANPPIVVFSPAKNGRTLTQKDTYNNLKKVPEVVINVVNYSIVQQISLSSSPYPPDVDEFVKAGFEKIPSEMIKPFRVKESPVQLECKVNQIIELGDGGAAGNLVICEVLKIHISEEVLSETGQIDQKKIDLVARMGGNWYCRANGDSLFEIEKPLTTIGIGFDSFPQEILNNAFLNKNEMALLASVESIPDETEVNEYKLLELSELFITLEKNPNELKKKLYQNASNLIAENKIIEAWKTILSFND